MLFHFKTKWCAVLLSLCILLSSASIGFSSALPTQWDLSKIYASETEFNAARTFVENNTLASFKGKLNTADAIYKCLSEYERLNIESTKLYVYAAMLKDTDSTNALYQTYNAQAIQTVALLGEHAAFLVPELLEQTDDFLMALANDPKFSRFNRFLTGVIDQRNTALDENSERILSMLTPLIEMPEELYTHLTLSDAAFGPFTNHLDHTAPFDMEWDTIYLYSKDQTMRNRAYEALYSPYMNYANTLASAYIAEVNTNVRLSQIRGYDSPLSYGLMGTISPEIYEQLIKSARANATTYQRYLNLKRKGLGLDLLHTSDLHLAYATEYADYFEYEQGVALVTEALKPLGDAYGKKLNAYLNSGNIDVYPDTYKTQSQYAWGAYDAPVYVLLNYNGGFTDVSTLAHELGHALHQEYINENQSFETSSIGPFPAEVTSIVNELLLMSHMASSTYEAEVKLSYMQHALDFYMQTFFEQAMLADFEYTIHQMVSDGETLTLEVLNATWMETAALYFGNMVTIDPFYAYHWMSIPHLYSNHYVYAYPLSLSVAHAIQSNINAMGNTAIDAYLSFLKLGGSESPEMSFEAMGIDLTKDVFYSPLFEEMNGLITAIETELNDPLLVLSAPPSLLSHKEIENIWSYYGISYEDEDAFVVIFFLVIIVFLVLLIVLLFILLLHSEKKKRNLQIQLLDLNKKSMAPLDWD